MRVSVCSAIGPMHAVIENGHAAVLAPKGLMPIRPADQSCPITLSSIFLSHASSRLVGIWSGRPANVSDPATLILLLHFSFIQATSFKLLIYNASSTTEPVSSLYYIFPPDRCSKMSDGEIDKESGKNFGRIPDETG